MNRKIDNGLAGAIIFLLGLCALSQFMKHFIPSP